MSNEPVTVVHNGKKHNLMDPVGFLVALGDFPADTVSIPLDALIGLWHWEMNWAIDVIAPMLSQVSPL